MPSSWPIAISSTPDSKPDCYSGWGDVGFGASPIWNRHSPSPARSLHSPVATRCPEGADEGTGEALCTVDATSKRDARSPSALVIAWTRLASTGSTPAPAPALGDRHDVCHLRLLTFGT
ncbi:hypothetical protein EBA13_07940 [Xanthomonas oryzae pv. oryzae]|nr:hypothetical protein EBA13_07940 [Xanthomonas oryzae pv. oryzae]TAP11338.1 hypothetical protein EYR04_07940 [Xanthomonas oryzae pv. oryzae]